MECGFDDPELLICSIIVPQCVFFLSFVAGCLLVVNSKSFVCCFLLARMQSQDEKRQMLCFAILV